MKASVKPFRVEFVDKNTMKRVDNLEDIIIEVDSEKSELRAYLIGMTNDDDIELEIRGR